MKKLILTATTIALVTFMGYSVKSHALLASLEVRDSHIKVPVLATGAVLTIGGLLTGGYANPMFWFGMALEAESNGVSAESVIIIADDTKVLVEIGLMSQNERAQVLTDMSRLQAQGQVLGFSVEKFTDLLTDLGTKDKAFEQIAKEDTVDVATVKYLALKVGIQ